MQVKENELTKLFGVVEQFKMNICTYTSCIWPCFVCTCCGFFISLNRVSDNETQRTLYTYIYVHIDWRIGCKQLVFDTDEWFLMLLVLLLNLAAH